MKYLIIVGVIIIGPLALALYIRYWGWLMDLLHK